MTDVRDTPANTNDSKQETGGFIWYELVTPDPEGSKAFYDAVVGWTFGESAPEFKGYRMIGRSDGGFAGGVLPLTAEMQAGGARPGWIGYLHVADVDRAVRELEAAGGRTWMPPTDIPNAGRVAMLGDPDGAAFYVMTPAPPAGDPTAKSDVFSPSAEQRVGWNELQTNDVDIARKFYGDQFGWGSDEYMDMGPNGLYRCWEHDGARIGALFQTDAGQLAHWRFYVRVPSISKAKAVAEAKGGIINMGPHQVPTGDYIIIGTDPQGAEFALVGGE
jgi:hypothetical protein